MLIALFIFIIYISVAFFYARELLSLKDQLIKAGATSADVAVPGEMIRLHSLVRGVLFFEWSPIKPTLEGRLWINIQQWKRLQLIAIFLFSITILTFLGLFLTYV